MDCLGDRDYVRTVALEYNAKVLWAWVGGCFDKYTVAC